ncbi:MAG TPA: sugar transferase [Geobacteraceae bacterium]|nr:sugar transferase [Geobacteraceae bacterium]
MLKEQNELIQRTAVCIDAAVVGMAFMVAFVIRDYPESHSLHGLPSFSECLPMLVFVVPLWAMALWVFGAYASMREKGFGKTFWAVFEASLAATFVFSTAGFLMNLDILSRTFVLTLFVTTVSMLTIEKWVTLLFLRNIRRKGHDCRVALIVGSGTRALKFTEMIERHSEWGIRILGYIDEPEMMGKTVGKGRVIGTLDDMARIIDKNVVDEVIFTMPRAWLDRLDGYIRICEKTGVKATVAFDLFDTAIARPLIREVDGWPLLTLDSTPHDFLHLSLKRCLDLAGSALGLLILSPLFLLITAAVKATSKGPVFFSQTRCGLNGRQFRILKFRTMVINAEKKLDELKRLNELEGPVFKIRHDPRITAVGRLLRKTSLDELPQLINVFRGDMSLVGPRPPIPSEVDRYERWQRRRLSMRPGITCIHEVAARNEKDFNKWMKLDLEYIDNWSFGLDFRILTMTVLAVVRGTGC